MSEWEEFCESKGWNAGSEDDYDSFLDSLEDRPIKSHNGGRPLPLVFETFEKASIWSKENKGAPFTRTPDGKYFTPIKKK